MAHDADNLFSDMQTGSASVTQSDIKTATLDATRGMSGLRSEQGAAPSTSQTRPTGRGR